MPNTVFYSTAQSIYDSGENKIVRLTPRSTSIHM
uniref:Uncharacterized protein n=1 Tax=Arundo donax TaxID=35708 RepID=A0A0A8Z9E5_ARUDO